MLHFRKEISSYLLLCRFGVPESQGKCVTKLEAKTWTLSPGTRVNMGAPVAGHFREPSFLNELSPQWILSKLYETFVTNVAMSQAWDIKRLLKSRNRNVLGSRMAHHKDSAPTIAIIGAG